MTKKRLWWTIRTCLIRSARKRAEYAKKQHIYAHIGENVSIQPRVIPLYSELISFHDNVRVARNVDFVTHDGIYNVFNRLPEDMRGGDRFCEPIGCIEVMDNVFIGSNSVIMNNTRIGPNVVIASGSVVTKDCEPNSVYAGVPAKKIGTFEELIQKRSAAEKNGTLAVTRHNQHLTAEEIAAAWAIFNRQREG